jgi:hypothetical protein
MHRLGRWTLNTLTALSLLLCAATLALWARSLGYEDLFVCESPTSQTVLDSSHWSIMWLRQGGATVSSPRPARWTTHRPQPLPKDNGLEDPHERLIFFGVGFASVELGPTRPRVRGGRLITVVLFYFLLAPAFALLPLLQWWASRRARARRTKGQCARCSYDLTGNVSGVCPECGTPTQSAEGAKSSPIPYFSAAHPGRKEQAARK